MHSTLKPYTLIISLAGWLVGQLFCSLSVQARPDVRVFTELSPPYQTMQSGQIRGTATHQVRRVLKDAGLSSEFELYPWARTYQAALKTPNGLIYSIAKTPERMNRFVWLHPVSHFRFSLVSLSSRDDISAKTLKPLLQYRFAVQRDDISHHWLVNQGMIENEHYLACSDIQCSWELLLKGKVDLIVEDPSLMTEILADLQVPTDIAKPIQNIPELEVVGYLAANPAMSPAILAKIENAIKALKSD